MSRWLVRCWLLFALAGAGCGFWAVRPPTPAATVRFQDLDGCPPPGERYYFLLFASESFPKRPRYTHTWATVVRVLDQGEGRAPAVEPHTISWLPATLRIHTFDFHVEPGVNLGLHPTIAHSLGTGQRVSMWGPYELRPGVYRKFLMQKQFVESGRLGYQCIDRVGEAAWDGSGSDCVHAITEADEAFGRDEHSLLLFGEDSGTFIVGKMMERGALIGPDRTHDWLIEALGLGCYPVVRRTARLAGPCAR